MNGKHSRTMKAIIRIAAVAIITILAALVGFGIGAATGIWIGPGALIMGFMGAGIAASSALAISGGLTAHGIFKDKKCMTVINDIEQTSKAAFAA